MIKKMLLLSLLFSYLFSNDVSMTSSYFVDKEHRFTEQNIYKQFDNFMPSSKKSTSFGLTNSTIWLHLILKNLSDKKVSNIIKFPYPLLDKIDFFSYKNGLLVKHYQTGDLTPYKTRAIKTNTFAFPYTLKSHQQKELLFKINSEGALNVGMSFYDNATFYTSEKEDTWILGIYYGAVIIMLLYNLVLYFIIKDRAYFDYAIFHFFYLSLQLGLNGLAFEYLWPDNPNYNLYFVPLALIFANYFSIKFSLSFLDVKQYHKKLFLYFKILMKIYSVLFLVVFISSYNLAVTLIAGASILSVSSLFLLGLYMLYKNTTILAKFYVIAWSFLLIGVLLTEFQNIGILPMNLLTLYGNQIGAFFELALLSFALAYRYNIIFLKLRQTENELLFMNQNLEKTVVQRTHALEEKNMQLSQEITNKSVLLRELYHRVKNNLQIISSILSMQSKRIKDLDTVAIYKQTVHRIQAMALVHEHLYQSNNLEQIDMQEYLKNFIHTLSQSYNLPHLEILINCDNITIDLEKAVPMGLIINELISNSIKHGFDLNQSNKRIKIDMLDEDEQIVLKVKDNGKGLNGQKLKNGFGSKLIKSLAEFQLNGSIEIKDDSGLQYTISFPKNIDN